MSIYRRWKIEQEIEGLLWKIDLNDLHDYPVREIKSSPSKVRHFKIIYSILFFMVYQFCLCDKAEINGLIKTFR